MGLFNQLFPTDSEESGLGYHAFWGAIADYIAGETTANQIKAGFNLNAQSQDDLDVWLISIDALVGLDEKLRYSQELHAVMAIAESGLKYADEASFRTRMGI